MDFVCSVLLCRFVPGIENPSALQYRVDSIGANYLPWLECYKANTKSVKPPSWVIHSSIHACSRHPHHDDSTAIPEEVRSSLESASEHIMPTYVRTHEKPPTRWMERICFWSCFSRYVHAHSEHHSNTLVFSYIQLCRSAQHRAGAICFPSSPKSAPPPSPFPKAGTLYVNCWLILALTWIGRPTDRSSAIGVGPFPDGSVGHLWTQRPTLREGRCGSSESKAADLFQFGPSRFWTCTMPCKKGCEAFA